MPTFQMKPVSVEAVQWFKVGDHPNVFKAAEPGGDGTNGAIRMNGGINRIVTPGSWIITDSAGNVSVMDDQTFKNTYAAG